MGRCRVECPSKVLFYSDGGGSANEDRSWHSPVTKVVAAPKNAQIGLITGKICQEELLSSYS